jgi:hypothetical protein
VRYAEIVGDHERAGERVEYVPPETYRVLFSDGTMSEVDGVYVRPLSGPLVRPTDPRLLDGARSE